MRLLDHVDAQVGRNGNVPLRIHLDDDGRNRVRTAVVRSAVESDPRSRVEKLTANVERDMVNHGAPSSRESTIYIS